MCLARPEGHLVRCKDMSEVEVKADSKANAEFAEIDPSETSPLNLQRHATVKAKSLLQQ